jgi:hypothetical protein
LRGKKSIRWQLSRGLANHREIALNHSIRLTVELTERAEKTGTIASCDLRQRKVKQ